MRTNVVKRAARAVRRRLGLAPMCRVTRELKRRGVNIATLHAVELFAYTGEYHVSDYGRLVGRLDLWEVQPQCEGPLGRRFPEASVKITDSYEETRTTSNKYDLIVADNPLAMHGRNGEHCEHFDLFPSVFRLAKDNAILVLSVIPRTYPAALKKFPYLFGDEQLARRREFYRTETPESVPLDHMTKVYVELASASGFDVLWHFSESRKLQHYLVLRLRRPAAGSEPPGAGS